LNLSSSAHSLKDNRLSSRNQKEAGIVVGLVALVLNADSELKVDELEVLCIFVELSKRMEGLLLLGSSDVDRDVDTEDNTELLDGDTLEREVLLEEPLVVNRAKDKYCGGNIGIFPS
jgi:hypothetical protein